MLNVSHIFYLAKNRNKTINGRTSVRVRTIKRRGENEIETEALDDVFFLHGKQKRSRKRKSKNREIHITR